MEAAQGAWNCSAGRGPGRMADARRWFLQRMSSKPAGMSTVVKGAGTERGLPAKQGEFASPQAKGIR